MSDTGMSRHNLDNPLFQLESNIVPLRYDLEFTPWPHEHVFTGRAAILFEVKEPLPQAGRQLVLHALSLTFPTNTVSFYPVPSPSAEAEGADAYQTQSMSPSVFEAPLGGSAEERGGQCVRVDTHDTTSETACFTFDRPLPNTKGDRFVLRFSQYLGRIYATDASHGLYHCSEQDAGVMATHLEPANARRLYPCYDEPRFSSVFCIAVVASSPYTVISNSPVEREEEEEAATESSPAVLKPHFFTTAAPFTRRRTVFAPTPPLHSCIVGFVMGRFQMVEQQSRKRGVLCRVVFPVDQPQHAGWFSLDLLTKALDFFDDFFDFALPLKKLDLVALECFASLGMENYGMITILMDFLLVTETTTLERRQRITRLIGHEVCHHWFGDWASVASWEYLWLKEGMCRYLEYYFTDAVNPGWCMWNEFLGSIMDAALVADANPATTHPVQFCDPHPRRILSSFNSISYAKGASLLRMLFSVIDIRTLKYAAHLLMKRHGNDCFDMTNFSCAIHDAHDRLKGTKTLPATTSMGALSNTSSDHSSALSRSPEVRIDATGTSDEEVDMHALIDSVLALAEVPGHPYILIEHVTTTGETTAQSSASADGKVSAGVRPSCAATPPPSSASASVTGAGTPTYRVSQYHLPLLHRGILPYFVRQQRQRHGPTVIDLLTPPVSTAFEWEPRKALRALTPESAFTVPLRVLEVTSLHGSHLYSAATSLPGGAGSFPYTNHAVTSASSGAAGAGAAAGPQPVQSLTQQMGMGGAGGGGTLPFLFRTSVVLLKDPVHVVDGTTLVPPPHAVWAAVSGPSTTNNSMAGVGMGPGPENNSPSMETTPAASNPASFVNPQYAFTSSSTNAWSGAVAGASFASTSAPGAVGPVHASRHVYFNYGGSGVFRCDGDIATWQRVFEMAPLLKDEDRMSITTTLARLRNMNIGRFPHDPPGSDRCTLFLEWIMVLTQSPALMSSFLWDYITERLEELLYMTQNAYCSRIFSDFVSSVYLPLHQRCLLSFFPHERTINFQSHLHLSRKTVASVMRVLALCGSPLVREACEEVAAWAVAALYPQQTFIFTSGSGGGDGLMDGFPVAGASVSGAATAAQPVMGVPTPLASERPLGESPHATASNFAAVGGASVPGAATSLSGGGGYLTSANSTPSGATHLDFSNDAHITAVMVALQYLVQSGERDAWRAAAGVVVAVTHTDVEGVERDMGLRIPNLSHPFAMSTDATKLTAVLPAFFSLDDDTAFEFMADVLGAFSRVSAGTIRALLRNTRFLTHLLENRRSTLTEWLLRQLILSGATLCSNGHAITLLKASVLYQENARLGLSGTPAKSSPTSSNLSTSPGNASTAGSVYSEYRAIDFMDDGTGAAGEEPLDRHDRRSRSKINDAADEGVASSSLQPARPETPLASSPLGSQQRKRKLLSPELAAAFDVMECNCVWVDYCGDHYERYLREQRTRRMWVPCESQMDSRCTPLGTDLGGSTPSPFVTTAPDGSLSYQGPVGGISI